MLDDITESYDEQLENDEINPVEAGFMQGEEKAELYDDNEEEDDEDEQNEEEE